mgnify:CR=1 FL=1
MSVEGSPELSEKNIEMLSRKFIFTIATTSNLRLNFISSISAYDFIIFSVLTRH